MELDWTRIGPALAAPFDPKEVDFRPQGGLGKDGKGRVVAYIDARNVFDRLDAVVGVGAWGSAWEPLILDKAVRVVRATITIAGVSKSDVGDVGDSGIEPSKSAVSDALKRAGVQWGIGRYLYGINLPRVLGEADGTSWRIPSGGYAELRAELRAKLPAPPKVAQGGTRPALQLASPPPADPRTGEILDTATKTPPAAAQRSQDATQGQAGQDGDAAELQAAWYDAKQHMSMAGYGTSDEQKAFIRRRYPAPRRIPDLTLAEVEALVTAADQEIRQLADEEAPMPAAG